MCKTDPICVDSCITSNDLSKTIKISGRNKCLLYKVTEINIDSHRYNFDNINNLSATILICKQHKHQNTYFDLTALENKWLLVFDENLNFVSKTRIENIKGAPFMYISKEQYFLFINRDLDFPVLKFKYEITKDIHIGIITPWGVSLFREELKNWSDVDVEEFMKLHYISVGTSKDNFKKRYRFKIVPFESNKK